MEISGKSEAGNKHNVFLMLSLQIYRIISILMQLRSDLITELSLEKFVDRMK